LLYKYRSFESEFFEDFFESKSIYLSCPSQLNDPFECKPHVYIPSAQKDIYKLASNWLNSKGVTDQKLRSEYTNEVMRSLSSQEDLLSRLHEILEGYGVYCFASTPTNILMWSHYGFNHEGFCIEFNTGSDYHLTSLAPYFSVHYQDKYPEFSIDLLYQEDLRAIELYHRTCLLTKSSIWKYEGEKRVIRARVEGGAGSMPIEDYHVNSFILGAKSTAENAERLRVLRDQHFPTASLKKAVLSNNKYEIRIEGA